MTSVVHSCRRDCMLDEVTRMMWDHDIGALPVVDDLSRPLAMITDRDACMAAYTQGRPLAQIKVESAMSRAVFTCHRHDQLGAAERTMRVHQVRRLPVVDDAGKLVGVLSLGDIALARSRSPLITRTAERLMGEVALTLAAICRRAAAEPTPEPAPEESWNPFEVQNSAAFREASPTHQHLRIPPVALGSGRSRLRT